MNLVSMHRMRRDSDAHPRDMRRTTIAGGAPTYAKVAAG